jgi:hypothetical protein
VSALNLSLLLLLVSAIGFFNDVDKPLGADPEKSIGRPTISDNCAGSPKASLPLTNCGADTIPSVSLMPAHRLL